MKFRKKVWLLKYYLFNVLFIKIMGRFVKFYELEWGEKFESLKKEVQEKNTDEILVVGNGPSLLPSDLTALTDLPSIASNKIYLLFEQTNWRPDLYTIHDPLLAYKSHESDFDKTPQVLCSNSIYYMLPALKGRKLPWINLPLDSAVKSLKQEEGFSPDPVTGFFEGYSVTIQNIQLAMWLGAKRIYLIGIDHSYNEDKSTKIGKKMEHKESSHFHPDYRKKGEIVNNASIDNMNYAYSVMYEVAKASGVEIVNISRNTKLDVYPKYPIDKLIDSLRPLQKSGGQ